MTTLATHTPGPWSVSIEPDKYDTGRDEIRVLAEEDRNHPQGPLTVSRINQHLAGESVANARLIAAAPDLLEALRGLIDQLEAAGIHIPGEDSGQWHGAEGISFSRAIEAIAKAEGRAE
jgi:hypothetical protein